MKMFLKYMFKVSDKFVRFATSKYTIRPRVKCGVFALQKQVMSSVRCAYMDTWAWNGKFYKSNAFLEIRV